MDIKTIIKKLEDASLLATDEESISFFSDCFNKFGISLLLLQDEEKFDAIVNLLQENQIPLQKGNSVYALRIFAIELPELNNIINGYKNIDEIEFLRIYPELMAEPSHIRLIRENMKKFQEKNIAYKNEEGYDLQKLFAPLQKKEGNKSNNPLNDCLKKHLMNPTLIDKLENNEGNTLEDVNVALELQKAENLICEEYLLPVDDGWKVVINNLEVNSFQDVKDTINTITQLNLPVNYHDALLLVLFYKTKLSPQDVEKIIKNDLFKEEK